MSKEVLEVDEATGAAVVVSSAESRKAEKLAKLEKAKKRRIERLADVENELLDDATEVLRGAHRFTEIAPNHEGPPPEHWVQEFGKERAERMLRAAQAAWIKQSESPMGLKLAAMTVGAVLKAKAAKDHKDAPRLNVAVIQLTEGHVPEFPILKVEK
jgi:hypothetical protein